MGLDITAYSHLSAVGKHTEDWCEEDYHVNAYAYYCFPQSFRGIPILSTSLHGQSGFFEGGCFAWTEGTETHDFRAGSYHGYNAWRDDLRHQFNPETDPDGPFYELIYFADNEGSIGPEAAKDLLADFRELAATYSPSDNWSEYGREVYGHWMRAFELGAADGLVRFH